MRGYVTSFFTAIGVLLVGFAGFILLIDPYDVVGGPAFDGVNARKTRTHEDGGRVTRSHRLMTTDVRAAVLGNSRVVDGFPAYVDDWPGGLINAGMRGANAFELARAIILAADNPNLDCLVVGLDLDDFGAHAKAQATYWITPLPDGARRRAIARMALSPHAFARALQTFEDNRTGGSDSFLFQERYEAGWQRTRFDDSVPGALAHYRAYHYDPERVAFFLDAVEAVSASGVQVLMFLHPLHAYREETLHAAGLTPQRTKMAAELAAAADRMSVATSRSACVPGPSVQLWDFGGFRPVSVSAPPDPSQELSHPYYHEPPHYRPVIGEAILAYMLGEEPAAAHGGDSFGVRVTPDTLQSLVREALERRKIWRQSDPVGQHLAVRVEQLLDEAPPAHGPLMYLTRDDQAGLARDVRRLMHAQAIEQGR